MQQANLRPPPQAVQAPPVDSDVPDIIRTRKGWYPRWWLLSAYICSSLIFVGYLLYTFVPCYEHGVFASICTTHAPADWEQITGIWLLFAVGWLLTLMFGIGPIEVPARPEPGQEGQGSASALFLRSISQFAPIHTLLLLYGTIAFLGIACMWFFNLLEPVPFALAVIILFVALCSELYRHPPQERRIRLFACGLFSAFLALISYLSIDSAWQAGDTHWVILVTEVGGFVASIVLFFRERRVINQNAAQLTPQARLEQAISHSVSPWYVLRSFWPLNRIFPNRPTI